MIQLQNYRSILCLNGSLPGADFFQSPLPVIATDGAANTLLNMGIKPDIVIGDLDSFNAREHAGIKTFYVEDQNFCDYEKSLAYLENNNLLPCIIVGIHGGYLDHIINNLNIFMRYNAALYAPPLYGQVLKENGSFTFNLPLHTKISLIGIPSSTVSTKGLQWELTQAPLCFPGKNSCFNRTTQDLIQITVHSGQLLVLIYCER